MSGEGHARNPKRLALQDVLIGKFAEIPELALLTQGLAPRSAQPHPSTPDFHFQIGRKLECWADNLAELYELAKAQRWNATDDIPWHRLPHLPDAVELSVCQVLTFLVQNEYAALYAPAKFIPRINPAYTEVALFLATQVEDEARHVEVMLKRALANGVGFQQISAITQYSLKSLLEQEGFAETSVMLHILGEGTFMDLFDFLLRVSPDPVFTEIVRLSLRDETRHVRYGLARAQHHLRQEPQFADTLYRAVEERATFLMATSGISDINVIDALAILAGGGAKNLDEGRHEVRELYRHMDAKRTERLRLAGFDERIAQRISQLHAEATRNAM